MKFKSTENMEFPPEPQFEFLSSIRGIIRRIRAKLSVIDDDLPTIAKEETPLYLMRAHRASMCLLHILTYPPEEVTKSMQTVVYHLSNDAVLSLLLVGKVLGVSCPSPFNANAINFISACALLSKVVHLTTNVMTAFGQLEDPFLKSVAKYMGPSLRYLILGLMTSEDVHIDIGVLLNSVHQRAVHLRESGRFYVAEDSYQVIQPQFPFYSGPFIGPSDGPAAALKRKAEYYRQASQAYQWDPLNHPTTQEKLLIWGYPLSPLSNTKKMQAALHNIQQESRPDHRASGPSLRQGAYQPRRLLFGEDNTQEEDTRRDSTSKREYDPESPGEPCKRAKPECPRSPSPAALEEYRPCSPGYRTTEAHTNNIQVIDVNATYIGRENLLDLEVLRQPHIPRTNDQDYQQQPLQSHHLALEPPTAHHLDEDQLLAPEDGEEQQQHLSEVDLQQPPVPDSQRQLPGTPEPMDLDEELLVTPPRPYRNENSPVNSPAVPRTEQLLETPQPHPAYSPITSSPSPITKIMNNLLDIM